MTQRAPIKVYYNSACPVCDAGIRYQQNKRVDNDIAWCDLHTQNRFRRELEQDLETLRKYLHVMDEHGSLHIGIDAFICLWQQVPSQRWLARLFSVPIIRVGAKLVYFIFANALYSWNKALRRW